MKVQNWSLALPLLFPVQSLFHSLLVACLFPGTNSVHSRENREKAKEVEVLIAHVINSVGIFPVLFPINVNFRPETGSRLTASTARTCLLPLARPQMA
jgi:hypothetical protein